jgi:thymidylate kinase
MMNDNWNISGLILEGVSGSGKSALLRELIRSERFVQRSFHSTIVLSEHQTQRVLERKERERGLTPADNLALLNQHVAYLESLRDGLEQMQWCQANLTDMRIPYLLERFHFTHVYHYPYLTWQEVESIDQRLARLNCKVCVFTADAPTLEQRIITDRTGPFRDYIKRFGATNGEIVQHYLDQQERLLALCRQSNLETRVVDTSSDEISQTVAQALDFWGAL